MSRKIVFVLSLVLFIIILNIIPVTALDVNITDKPEIIHISSPESFVRLTLSDGTYLVMPTKPSSSDILMDSIRTTPHQMY